MWKDGLIINYPYSWYSLETDNISYSLVYLIGRESWVTPVIDYPGFLCCFVLASTSLGICIPTVRIMSSVLTLFIYLNYWLAFSIFSTPSKILCVPFLPHFQLSCQEKKYCQLSQYYMPFFVKTKALSWHPVHMCIYVHIYICIYIPMQSKIELLENVNDDGNLKAKNWNAKLINTENAFHVAWWVINVILLP